MYGILSLYMSGVDNTVPVLNTVVSTPTIVNQILINSETFLSMKCINDLPDIKYKKNTKI
jgi:hypothetical protein